MASPWVVESFFALAVVAMILAAVTRTTLSHRIELIVLWFIAGLGLCYNAVNLYTVIHRLVFEAVKPSTLFYTALTIWINNVLIFALTYFLIDGGGPDARKRRAPYPDFDFPGMHAGDEVRPGWRPGVVDYLFLGFMTATAFSPTEAQPLTARAKLLMIVESAMSLTTIAVVGARAINIIQ
ncbi:MAG: hypothetical protein JO113_06785 [Candidatus Eremiobacteraeota bacterium]|nr:hypothetical protein [Candidatus Eremiobacteraeota bacterium]